MKNKWIKVFAITGAAVWWLVFYPELSFIDGTYELVLTEHEKQIKWIDGSDSDIDLTADISGEDLLSGLLHAGKDEIVIESRLLEWLSGQR